jgi:hypothetical protein
MVVLESFYLWIWQSAPSATVQVLAPLQKSLRQVTSRTARLSIPRHGETVITESGDDAK